ncbi:unnamed protein product [Eruca vesicaria subsp. sativa]|uniref:Uncharacterized protein n=1 Tax=Eruca vesicaria subsp. sativa TaxID=29727 RepID=A0ABC8JC88_ERUVS|nr:unnamed protein product [Eruca vesicaria subsp. sativa]
MVRIEGALVGEECDAWGWYLEDVYFLRKRDDPDWVRPKHIIENEKNKTLQLTPIQEYELINAQIEASEGFDVDWTKARCLYSYHPVEFDEDAFVEKPETNLDLVNMLCDKSIGYYNKENNTAYEFVKALYANFHASVGIMFLITFQVKDPSDNNLVKDFQARVFYSFCSKSQFILCRPKQHQPDSLEVAQNDPKKPRLE